MAGAVARKMRLFAIGDIHGCYAALLTLSAEVGFGAQDVVVVLGDYVDRGPDSCLVLDHLIALAQRATLVPLLGNHELMMLRAREGGSNLEDWISAGGSATLDSYRAQSPEGIPARHWEFLKTCRPFYETERDFFVHANADPDRCLADQNEGMLYWQRFGYPSPHQSGRRMICGHTQQRDGRPLDLGHAVCLDTCAYEDGWLTCLEVGSGVYWQANQLSQIRIGTLQTACRCFWWESCLHHRQRDQDHEHGDLVK